MKLSQIKKDIAKYSLSDNPFVDDAIIKGGYRVVRTVKERNAIDCCHRKLGMRVMVMGQDYSYKEYILKGENPCSNDNWELDEGGSGGIDTINDSDVTLLDDYSDLDITQNIETQQDLNQVLATILRALLNNHVVGDKYYLHIQSIPSDEWICHHNLGKFPAVPYIMDSAGNVHFASPINIDLNTSIIRLGTPMAGSAPFN